MALRFSSIYANFTATFQMHEPTFVDFEANDEKSVVEEIQESRSDQSI